MTAWVDPGRRWRVCTRSRLHSSVFSHDGWAPGRRWRFDNLREGRAALPHDSNTRPAGVSVSSLQRRAFVLSLAAPPDVAVTGLVGLQPRAFVLSLAALSGLVDVRRVQFRCVSCHRSAEAAVETGKAADESGFVASRVIARCSLCCPAGIRCRRPSARRFGVLSRGELEYREVSAGDPCLVGGLAGDVN